jgi:hypothetical protein
MNQSSVSQARLTAYDRNMDLMAVITPGAQSLVTAVLTDSWSQARAALSRLWAHRRPAGLAAGADSAALEHVGTQLDLARTQAIEVAGEGTEPERASRMEVFWIGYLAGQIAARPELAEAIQMLPGMLGAGSGSAPVTVAANSKTVSGTVHGNAIQADDVSGGINIGR